jgi:cobalamin biosynthesis protein CbiD
MHVMAVETGNAAINTRPQEMIINMLYGPVAARANPPDFTNDNYAHA